MKKQVVLAVLLASVLTACHRGSDEPELEPQTIDDVAYLQASVAPVSPEGRLISRVCGLPLDASDTTVLSVGAGSLDNAVEIVRSLVYQPSRLKAAKDGSYTYALRRTDGSQRGQLTLKPATDGGNLLATLSVTPAGLLQYVSEVQFLAQWPENGSSPYSLGYFRTRNDIGYVCLREAKTGVLGLFVGVTDAQFDMTTLLGKSYDACVAKVLPKETVLALASVINTSTAIQDLYESNLGVGLYDYLGYVWNDGIRYGLGMYQMLSGDTLAVTADSPKAVLLTYSTFVDGVVHGTGLSAVDEFFPQYGGTTYDNDITQAQAPRQTLGPVRTIRE